MKKEKGRKHKRGEGYRAEKMKNPKKFTEKLEYYIEWVG